MQSFSAVVALLILAMSGACTSIVQRAPQAADGESDGKTAVIVVARRGWHVDVGFAAAAMAPPLASLREALPGAQFLLFGFGDRRFLQARNGDVPAMLAALWPGRALILMTGLEATPEAAFGDPQVIRIAVTPRQARAAEAYVWHSLSAVDGVITATAEGPYRGSLFFGAVPKYSALHTCNTWAAQVLEAAGVPVRSTGVLFAGQLWSQVVALHADD